MADDETVANIGSNDPYYPTNKPMGPANPTYEHSVKVTGGFKDPGPGGMCGADWAKASR